MASQLNAVKKIFLVAILLLIALLIALIAWFAIAKPTQPPAITDIPPQPTQAAIPASPTNITQSQPTSTQQFITGLENLPKSLQGTAVDGEIIIDENHNLVVTRGLRRLFDYFLTTQGEESLADIIARVEAYIRSRTPEPASSQTVALWHQYLNYLTATATVEEAGGKPAEQIDIDAVIQQKQKLADLRKQFFDDKTIKAFWGDEDAYDTYSIGLLKLSRNNQLTEAERTQAQQQLLDNLPEGAMKTQIENQQNLAKLLEQTAKLKAKGANAQQLRQLREQLVGSAAADRLEALDLAREQWQTRVQQYLDGRQAILNSTATEASKQQQIQTLRHRYFTENEQKRLTAYETLGKATLD